MTKKSPKPDHTFDFERAAVAAMAALIASPYKGAYLSREEGESDAKCVARTACLLADELREKVADWCAHGY